MMAIDHKHKRTVLLATCYLFSREADANIFGAVEQQDPTKASAMYEEGHRLQAEADRIYEVAHGTTEAWRRAMRWMKDQEP